MSSVSGHLSTSIDNGIKIPLKLG